MVDAEFLSSDVQADFPDVFFDISQLKKGTKRQKVIILTAIIINTKIGHKGKSFLA